MKEHKVYKLVLENCPTCGQHLPQELQVRDEIIVEKSGLRGYVEFISNLTSDDRKYRILIPRNPGATLEFYRRDELLYVGRYENVG